MLISIDNLNFPYHFEIIESIIQKYNFILKIPKKDYYLICLENIREPNFIKYINQKYPLILINKKRNNYNYKIYTTFYPHLSNKFSKYLNNNEKKHYFISHNLSNSVKFNNVYFLTPLCNTNKFLYTDCLPFNNEKKKSDIPIYIVQGNFTEERRNYNLLINILKHNYDHDFKIKFIGRGKLPSYLNKYNSKFIVKKNLNFIDYHKEFQDGYCILPLILKSTHKQYYTNKLTSTINYKLGYNLKCLIDKDLQNIYKLDNVEIFNNENDIHEKFNKTLIDYYKNNKIF